MAQNKVRRAAADSPQSAAGFVRRSAQRIRASAAGLSQYRAECKALIHWAEVRGLLLSPEYIEQFHFIGDGAEHRVYRDDADDGLAIKSTHPNKYGYSVAEEGMSAYPCEYLRRLGAQNQIFGDDIKVVGIIYSEGHTEIVTSQPWISVHRESPNPSQEEIDVYMGEFGFEAVSFNLDTPAYYSVEMNLVVLDAHDRNILRDRSGRLVAIDLIIGPPSQGMCQQIEAFRNDPLKPF